MSAQVKIEVRQISATTSEAVARQYKVLSDRSEAKGGQHPQKRGCIVADGGLLKPNFNTADGRFRVRPQ